MIVAFHRSTPCCPAKLTVHRDNQSRCHETECYVLTADLRIVSNQKLRKLLKKDQNLENLITLIG